MEDKKSGPSRPRINKEPQSGGAKSSGLPSLKAKKSNRDMENREYRTITKSGMICLLQQSQVIVYDETTKKNREIRYCPNESSIWRDEQSSAAVRRSIVFKDGRLFVRYDEPSLREYLDTHPGNKSNKGNFFLLVDKDKTAADNIKEVFLVNDAINLVRTSEFGQLLAVASAFDMRTDRPASEIKHDLVNLASKNPERFINSFNDPAIAVRVKLKMAIENEVVKYDKGAIRWYDNGKQIVSVPKGKNHLDIGVRYLMTEEAASTWEAIESQL